MAEPSPLDGADHSAGRGILFQMNLLSNCAEILSFTAVVGRELFSKICNLAAAELMNHRLAVAHRMEFLGRLRSHKQFHDTVHESHNTWYIHKELLLKQFRIVCGKHFDRFRGGRLDLGRLAEERDGLVVMNLVDLVRVVVGRDSCEMSVSCMRRWLTMTKGARRVVGFDQILTFRSGCEIQLF